MSEHVDAKRIAEIIPYSARQIIELAKAGEIPGAFQLVDKGKWLFDERRARQWFKQRELEQCRKNQTSIKEVKFGTSKLSVKAGKSVSQLEKLLWPGQGNSETGRSINSRS